MEADVDAADPRPPVRILALAARPGAAHWARECGWMPGTGYCRNRSCGAACVLRDQCEAEAARIVAARRQRRPSQRPGAGRAAPSTAALLALTRLLRTMLA